MLIINIGICVNDCNLWSCDAVTYFCQLFIAHNSIHTIINDHITMIHYIIIYNIKNHIVPNCSAHNQI